MSPLIALFKTENDNEFVFVIFFIDKVVYSLYNI